MAKALLGHTGLAPDPRLLAEVRRLRVRVQELEGDLALLRADYAASVTVEDDVRTLLAGQSEPALT